MESTPLCMTNTTDIAVLKTSVSDIKDDVKQIRSENKEIRNDVKELKAAIEDFINQTIIKLQKVEKIDEIENAVNELKTFKTGLIFTCMFIGAIAGFASNVISAYRPG